MLQKESFGSEQLPAGQGASRSAGQTFGFDFLIINIRVVVQPSCFPRDLFTITCQRSAALFVLKTAFYSKVWFHHLEIDCAVARVERLWVLERRAILWTSISPWKGFTKWEVAMTGGILRHLKTIQNVSQSSFRNFLIHPTTERPPEVD